MEQLISSIFVITGIGPAGQQTYRAIVLINPAATAAAATATAILPNLKTKIVITQSIFELGP